VNVRASERCFCYITRWVSLAFLSLEAIQARSSWIKANLDVFQQDYEHARLFAYGTNIEFALPCIVTKYKNCNNNEQEKNIIEDAPAGSQLHSTQNEKPERAPAVCPDKKVKKRPCANGPVTVNRRKVAFVSTEMSGHKPGRR
jgi:hypothetical protein